jgi:CBS domain containing-hemolysin-like protein
MSGLHVGELLIALACIVLGSFVAGTESVVGAMPEPRIRALLDELGASRGAQLERYLNDPTRVLTVLLAFRVTALIVASVMATNAIAHGRDAAWKLVLVISVLALAYGSLTALFAFAGRARARVYAPLSLALARPLELLTTPVALPLRWLSRAIEHRVAQRHSADPPPLTEREVEYVVEQAEESGALDAKRGQMLQNVLELKDLTAREVMVPRTGVRAVRRARASRARSRW